MNSVLAFVCTLGVFILVIALSWIIPMLIAYFKKCNSCGNRFDKTTIHGQYNCTWYECNCGSGQNFH